MLIRSLIYCELIANHSRQEADRKWAENLSSASFEFLLLAKPFFVTSWNERYRLLCIVDTVRDREGLRIGARKFGLCEILPAARNEIGPHAADENRGVRVSFRT